MKTVILCGGKGRRLERETEGYHGIYQDENI